MKFFGGAMALPSRWNIPPRRLWRRASSRASSRLSPVPPLKEGVVCRVHDEVFWRRDAAPPFQGNIPPRRFWRRASSRASSRLSPDSTEKNRLASQLLRHQRMESIGTLAGGMAHDLNNILAPASLWACNCSGLKFPDAESRQLIDMVNTSALRGARRL